MTMRRRLADRRASVRFNFSYIAPDGAPRKFIGSVSTFDNDGVSPAELFINTSQRAGSEADINASDAAIAVSLALQYGCPLEVLREAMKRNPDGSPQGPLGAALDTVADLVKS